MLVSNSKKIMKTKIEIKSTFEVVLFEFEKENNTIKDTVCEANLRGADLREANLRGANLRGADLRGADLNNFPESYINSCSRDILFILNCLKTEVPALRKMLIEGKVDGSQYEGECACLIGSLANADGGMDKVCAAIPFYVKGIDNPGEAFFFNIRKGDTPETSQFSKHAVMLCDMVLAQK